MRSDDLGDESSENSIPKILIVDDHDVNRRILSRILHEYHIMEAVNGREALNLVQQHEFDVVLLDIMMPDMNGLEVLKEIRLSADNTELPVILVSALTEKQNIVHGLELGANDYMPKPVDVVVVKARVQAQIQIKAAFAVQKKALRELQKADLLKNRLLSIASHDLKVPLASIYMAESLLRNLTDADDTTVATVLDTMRITLDNMNDIIIEFLDMASLQNGAITIDMQDVDLQYLITTVIDQYELSSKEKGSIIIPPETDGIVSADPTRLAQVLSNLISNALKFSPPNSTITVNVVELDETYVIEVADAGPGIPEKERDLLFTEFSKLSTRPTGAESSTGLGLWIVKQLTEMMDGRVGVYFPESGGSIFWIELHAYSSTPMS